MTDAPGGPDAAAALHVPLGYGGESAAFGRQLAAAVIGGLRSGAWHRSRSNAIWGARADICVPLDNELFARRLRVAPAPGAAGSVQSLRLPSRMEPYVAIRAVDAAGSVGLPLVLSVGR